MRRTWLTGALTGAAISAALLAFGRSMFAQGGTPPSGRIACAVKTQEHHPPKLQGGTPPSGRIACLNVIQVLNEYQRQKDLIEEVNAKREKLQAENNERRSKIDALDAEISALDPTDPTMATRMRELLAMQIDYKNWGEMAQMAMAREFGLWAVRNYKDIIKAAEEIAKRDGYDLVLYKGEFEMVSMDPEVINEQIRSLHVIYANPATDITQVVLDKINSEYRAQPRRPLLQVP